MASHRMRAAGARPTRGARAGGGGPPRGGAPRPPGGQSLVEFALIAPVLFLILLGTIQVAQGIMTWSAVGAVVAQATREASIAGGENTVVDNKVQQFAASAGLHAHDLTVCIDTDTGAGQCHPADAPAAGDAPPGTLYDNTVTVRLSYRLPLIFSIGGARFWLIGASQSGGVSTSIGGAP